MLVPQCHLKRPYGLDNKACSGLLRHRLEIGDERGLNDSRFLRFLQKLLLLLFHLFISLGLPLAKLGISPRL